MRDLHADTAPHVAQVTAKQHKAPSRCGYLYKYRPFATGLFSNTWELRFFTLNGSALQYHKSEKDATLHPRGYVDVAVRTSGALVFIRCPYVADC